MVALIGHPKDFWSGILFIALGGAAFLIALDYTMGSAGRMGPGYFPRSLGVLMAALGAILVLRSFRLSGAPLTFPTLMPVVIVLGSVLLFGLTVTWLGLILSTILLVIVSSVASHEFRWIEATIASVALAIFVVLAFRWGLQIQLPIWPPAIAG